MDFETPEGKLFSKRNIIGILTIGIILLVIPVGMKFLQSAQIIKSRADVDPITIVVPQSNIVCDSNQQNCVASSNSFDIELRSPLGPAAPVATTPPNPTAAPRDAATATPIPTAGPSPTPVPSLPTHAIGGCTKQTDGTYKVFLSWEGSANNTNYIVGITGSGSYGVVAPATTYTTSGEANKTYEWYVKACIGSGNCSDWKTADQKAVCPP